MPNSKNSDVRIKVIDRCLSDRTRNYSTEMIFDLCNEELDKKLFNVCLHCGEGDDEIIFNMGIDQETIDMMGKIRKEDSAKWENYDIDLFHAAVDRLKKLE